VNLSSVRPAPFFAMGVFQALFIQIAAKSLTVASANDGNHMENSKHFVGEAFDVRTRNVPEGQVTAILIEARKILEPLGYDVVDETMKPGAPHIHCEYDPKGSEMFYHFLPEDS